MSYEISGNRALISGKTGAYGKNAKGANYGKNAAANHFGYIESLKTSSAALNPDVFTKSNDIDKMLEEVQKLENEKMPPLNFTLKYAPKFNAVKGFFARLFKGSAINKQALLGFSYETMDNRQAISLEEADKAFQNEAFKNVNAKLTAKAFDVNNDGQIDISEEAVSTVIADVLSKDEGIKEGKINLKKADGSYTNEGENKMMTFCNEENLETASKIAKEVHTKLKLDKELKKFQG